MDRDKFSAIGHRGMEFWNPVSGAVIDSWIQRLELPRDGQVLDVGCGHGEVLRRIYASHGCSCVGVEQSAQALAAGAASSDDRMLQFLQQDFQSSDFQANQFDGIACIGSSQAVGSLEDCLRELRRLLKPGGWLWIGTGYWQEEPEQGYLDFLQCGRDEMGSHPATLEQFLDWGWTVDRHHLTSAEEWAAYEDGYADNIRQYVGAHPDDADCAAMSERIEAWREAYLKWGQTTLGFGLYWLQNGKAE